MHLGDLLTPWLMLAAVIIPLIYVERWIHSHLYGVGWLLTNDYKSATALYYVLLFPGVFVHEFTQYLFAGIFDVKIKRVIAWPEAQKDGTLRLDFVQIQKASWFPAAIIGAAPLIVGLALVWLISSQVLGLDNVLAVLETGNLEDIGPALRDLASTPDFYLWLYLVFTISNAMLPTPIDRQSWPLLIGLFVAVMGLLVVIGVGDVLLETFSGPVAAGVDRVTSAFAMVLIAEVPGIIFIGFLEEILERTTKRKFKYERKSAPSRARTRTRQPGSNVPLPPGTPLPSIYNLDLPLPTPSDKRPSPTPTHRPSVTTNRPTSSTSTPDTAPAQRRPAPRPSVTAPRQPAAQLTRQSTTQPPPRTPTRSQPGAAPKRKPVDSQRNTSRPEHTPSRPTTERPAQRPPASRAEKPRDRTTGANQPPAPGSRQHEARTNRPVERPQARPPTGQSPTPFQTSPQPVKYDADDIVGEEHAEETLSYEDFDDGDVWDMLYSDDLDDDE